MKQRAYSERDLAAAKIMTLAVLILVVLCTALIVNGWPL